MKPRAGGGNESHKKPQREKYVTQMKIGKEANLDLQRAKRANKTKKRSPSNQ
jgi:hypothetical protein